MNSVSPINFSPQVRMLHPNPQYSIIKINACKHSPPKTHITFIRALFFFLKFYWSIFDLQYCDNFCYTTNWFSYTYTHIHSFRFFSHKDYHRMLGRVPWAIEHVPIGQSFPIPQCVSINPKPRVHPSPATVPLGNHKFAFKICKSASILQICSLYPLFRFHI